MRHRRAAAPTGRSSAAATSRPSSPTSSPLSGSRSRSIARSAHCCGTRTTTSPRASPRSPGQRGTCASTRVAAVAARRWAIGVTLVRRHRARRRTRCWSPSAGYRTPTGSTSTAARGGETTDGRVSSTVPHRRPRRLDARRRQLAVPAQARRQPRGPGRRSRTCSHPDDLHAAITASCRRRSSPIRRSLRSG